MASLLPLLSLTVLQALAVAVLGQDGPTPVVLWHGMGDSAAGMIGIAVTLALYCRQTSPCDKVISRGYKGGQGD